MSKILRICSFRDKGTAPYEHVGNGNGSTPKEKETGLGLVFGFVEKGNYSTLEERVLTFYNPCI
ncbi:hypothetical protein EFB08_01005 [Rufibacter latericius]|uniref:Uncharacterized protein n=1 Tax=Rufibacter latericius TaxID=2487040 RepID=A0A3M9N0A3_9BACT|nr:hypothetical protein EFB08_01005 [Rufibacter latericius]